MSADDRRAPAQVPVLSRGKHRNPRKGACFMEFVSYLAGERWNDHPSCTHPLLASVARLVNDHTSDEGRAGLTPHIPSVIGLVSDDPRVAVRIALVCARAALPVVAAERQHAVAVGILACERALDELDGRPAGTLEAESRAVLAEVPHAAKWARDYAGEQRFSLRAFRRRGTPSVVATAVKGVAEACVPDADDRLHALLVAAIGECAAAAGHDAGSGGMGGVDPAAATPVRR